MGKTSHKIIRKTMTQPLFAHDGIPWPPPGTSSKSDEIKASLNNCSSLMKLEVLLRLAKVSVPNTRVAISSDLTTRLSKSIHEVHK